MGVLTAVEGALRGLFEGLFGRAFGGSLTPEELLRRFATEVVSSEQQTSEGARVANTFRIELAASDWRTLRHELPLLRDECRGVYERLTREQDLRSVGPFDLEFAPGERLASGQVRIAARLRPGAALVRVEVVAGNDRGKVFEGAARDLVIGRTPQCTICVADEDVSRRHAALCSEGDELIVEDLGSTNGTYLGGRAIHRERLDPGAVLEMGATLLRVERTGVAWDTEVPAGIAALGGDGLP